MDRVENMEESLGLLSLSYELVRPIGSSAIEIADKKSLSLGFYDLETGRLETPKYKVIQFYEKYIIMQDINSSVLIYYRDLDEIHTLIQMCNAEDIDKQEKVGLLQLYKKPSEATNINSPFYNLTINRLKIIEWNSRCILINSDTVKSEYIIFDTVEMKEVYRGITGAIRISTNKKNLFCISFLDLQTHKYMGVSDEGTFEIIDDYIYRKFPNSAIKKQANKGFLIKTQDEEYTYNKYGQLY